MTKYMRCLSTGISTEYFWPIELDSLEPQHAALFSYHYLKGMDWKLCCTKMGLTQPEFIKLLEETQEKIGAILNRIDHEIQRIR